MPLPAYTNFFLAGGFYRLPNVLLVCEAISLFYGGRECLYTTVHHKTKPGKAIGVAVADCPIGPFKDARGRALIRNDMTTFTHIDWDDIDPSVLIDDGQAYLFWVIPPAITLN